MFRNDDFQNAKAVKGLQDYHLLKRKYDQEGISLLQMNLLRAFGHICKSLYFRFLYLIVLNQFKPLEKMSLIKNIALFS